MQKKNQNKIMNKIRKAEQVYSTFHVDIIT